MHYAKKYEKYLLNHDFSMLQSFSKHKQNHILKSLNKLAKFLGIYKDFQHLMKSYGLNWQTSNIDELIISRITNTKNSSEVLKWIKTVKNKLPKLKMFMDFILISGLRFKEVVNSYNLIIELANEGKLSEYYNAEEEVLEHYRFKDIFLRRTKKVFISVIPKSFIILLSKQHKISQHQILHWIKRKDLPLRFSNIREYFATYMTKHLNQPEIDFLQGRVSANVFMRNYFNPNLIEDLKKRTFQGIKNIKRNL